MSTVFDEETWIPSTPETYHGISLRGVTGEVGSGEKAVGVLGDSNQAVGLASSGLAPIFRRSAYRIFWARTGDGVGGNGESGWGNGDGCSSKNGLSGDSPNNYTFLARSVVAVFLVFSVCSTYSVTGYY
ncbi:hypothetical protein TcasGA2_TC002038 [Tribolium castaneum]|uniref:Uncharacterized protein n=1 Tax=Tribolium castaneum TaxID=7070 RepID=D7ELF8_TRICA|nr:hypothetical protein TcasGA2_TC002038 [Tribolium castaneum]